MGQIRVGTSGWIYRDWRGLYYPQDLPTKRWFEYYSRDFDTVEVNNTFYRLPGPEAFMAWRKQAPAGFLYALKCNRYLTHNLKLTKAAEPLDRFISRAFELAEHLGPVLYQLPPRWKKNVSRLDEFCAQLPRDVAHVVEFREADWLADDAYAVLKGHGVGLCIHDLIVRHPKVVTSSTVYVRFHGAKGKYFGNYSRDQLRRWCDWMLQMASNGADVYAYFNNDQQAAAVKDATALKDLVASRR